MHNDISMRVEEFPNDAWPIVSQVIDMYVGTWCCRKAQYIQQHASVKPLGTDQSSTGFTAESRLALHKDLDSTNKVERYSSRTRIFSITISSVHDPFYAKMLVRKSDRRSKMSAKVGISLVSTGISWRKDLGAIVH